MEIILHDVVLPKLFCVFVSKFVKIIFMYFVYTHSKKLKRSDHVCGALYRLHSDEVVSLISGCESVVYSCSPMVVTFYVLLLNC